MDVPTLLQPTVTLPGIGDDRCPRLDVIQHEGVKRFCGGIRHGRHSTAPESLRLQDLDRDTRQDLLPFGTASRKSRFLASDVGFVHLHLPAKALPIGANQPRPQAMKDSPHRLVGADLQGPLKLSAEIPSLPLAKYQQAESQTVSGVRVRSKMVPAITDVRLPHPVHLNLPSPSCHPSEWPQDGQTKP